jgi:hypothetical protein
MKTKIFSVMTLVAVMVGASCAKEDPAKPVDYSAPEKQATIQGTLLIVQNLTAATLTYSAAQEVTVIASVSYSQLGNPSAAGAFSTSVTTGSDGKFTLQVPADEDGASVSIVVNDREGTRMEYDYSRPLSQGDYATVSKAGIWMFNINSQMVKSGQAVIIPAAIGSFYEDKKAGGPVSGY